MRRYWIMAIVLAGMLGAAGSTLAADIAPVPPLVSINPWDGFYVGGHTGFTTGSSSWSRSGPSANFIGSSHMIGEDGQFGPGFGGLEAGYNHVLPSGFLIGVSADFSFPDSLQSGTALFVPGIGSMVTQDSVEIFGALRARAGYTFGNWLIYGTGGFAYDRDLLQNTDVFGNIENVYFWRPGWTVGAGAELRLNANWSAKLEYDFMNFAGTGFFLPQSGQFYRSNLDLHQVQFGLNYRFDGGATTGQPANVGAVRDMSNWSLHGQSTVISQTAFPFHSQYVGPNSLNPNFQARETSSVTAFLGWKPWEGTEIYYNPEVFQGFGLSSTHGLAGFSNGEAQKSGFNFPDYNTSRLYVRHTFGLGGEQEDLEDGADQVATKLDISRLTFTFGKLTVSDIFDNNAYAHDTRTGFMNWALWEAGAFDYAGDQKGYTWGLIAELNQKNWAVRTGYFLLPDAPNANDFDTRLGRRGQYVAEFEDRYSLFGQTGKLRLTAWLSEAYAGNFNETLAIPFLNPLTAPAGSPGIDATQRTRTEYGFIANVEQPVTDNIGVFSRLSWRNGQTQIMAFTDIDRSASIGTLVKGTSWSRPDDKFGAAFVVNGLSDAYRNFLAAGGLGVNIGDGRLSYQTEKIFETFYSISLTKWASLSFDYQFVGDPAYNVARGPVSIGSVRLHVEF